MATSFEEAKSFLQKSSDKTGVSVYDHLSDLVLQLLKDSPQDALANIETISAQIKAARLHPIVLEESRSVDPSADVKAKVKSYNEGLLGLFPAAPAEADVEAPKSEATLPDLTYDQALLKWAGIALTDEESFKVSLALEKLALKDPAIASIRLFGKFLGTSHDYIVAETKLSAYPEASPGAEEAHIEAPGKGANEFVYFALVTGSGWSWQRLPDVEPDQIRIAESKRFHLKGFLSGDVGGMPSFRWSEASYLRAIIALIAASTTVSPKGYFELKEEEGVIAAEEFAGVNDATTLLEAASWAHNRGGLLKQGRIEPWVKPEADTDAEQTEPAAEDEPEEVIPALRDLADEWTFRVSGGIASARSLAWPGALTVAKGKTFANFYIGNGQRQLAAPFKPILPHEFQTEFKDEGEEPVLVEQTDPAPPPKSEEAPKDPAED